jgi:hypothetical protein
MSAIVDAMVATAGYRVVLYRGTALAGRKAALALLAAALGAAAFGAAEFIIYLELWGGGGQMGVIFTMSDTVSNKL